MSRIDLTLRVLLGVFFLLLVLLAGLAPIIQTSFGYPSGEGLYSLLSPICHQYPTRSFWALDRPFALCSRCVGGYLGVGIGLMVIPLYRQYYKRLLWGLLMILPTVIDGVVQLNSQYESTNILRILTGIIGGIGLFLIAYPIQTVRRNRKEGEK
jgi:uncharacterized membrane protein